MSAQFHPAAQNVHRWELPEVGVQAAASEAASAPAQPTIRELEAIQQEARNEGYAAGMQQALAEGRMLAQQQLQQRVATLEGLCEAAARPLQLLDDQASEELAQLAAVVARRVVMHELKLTPGLIAGVVRQAAAALPMATRELRVYVHPEDLALLHELGTVERNWQLLADPDLSRGDCRFESERSRLDARVETRLAGVIDALLGDDVDMAEVQA